MHKVRGALQIPGISIDKYKIIHFQQNDQEITALSGSKAKDKEEKRRYRTSTTE